MLVVSSSLVVKTRAISNSTGNSGIARVLYRHFVAQHTHMHFIFELLMTLPGTEDLPNTVGR